MQYSHSNDIQKHTSSIMELSTVGKPTGVTPCEKVWADLTFPAIKSPHGQYAAVLQWWICTGGSI